MKPEINTSIAAVVLLSALATALLPACSRDSGDPGGNETPDLPTGPIQISAASNHTCALNGSGIVKCWGMNMGHQAGSADGDSINIATEVKGIHQVVKALSSGDPGTCVVTESGTVGCWGSIFTESDGSWPYGTMSTSVPTMIDGLPSAVSAVSVGPGHLCALTDAGAVLCWGGNSSAQLGLGNNSFELSTHIPTQVPGLESGVIAVSALHQHTCVITENREVLCWGCNGVGQWGCAGVYSPTLVEGLGSDITAIAGHMHTCALTMAGAVKCWGHNNYGCLGSGAATPDFVTIPVQVVGLDSGVVAITASRTNTCALTDAGKVMCWGLHRDKCVSDTHNFEPDLEPYEVLGLEPGIVGISAGYDFVCAIYATAKAMCWGRNGWGELGDGTDVCRNEPAEVVGLP